jgi:hypothetical protein
MVSSVARKGTGVTAPLVLGAKDRGSEQGLSSREVGRRRPNPLEVRPVQGHPVDLTPHCGESGGGKPDCGASGEASPHCRVFREDGRQCAGLRPARSL